MEKFWKPLTVPTLVCLIPLQVRERVYQMFGGFRPEGPK